MKYIFPILFLGLLFSNCSVDTEAAPIIDPVVQFATDETDIEAFLAAENLTAEVTASGLRYIVEDLGTGEPISSVSSVNVLLKGYFLDGTTFSQSGECSPSTLSLSRIIPGLSEGIQQFNIWGKGRIFMPSALAFGQNGSTDANVPPNTVLGFDIEIVEQKEFDNTKIKDFIAENNLTEVDSTLSGIYYTITEAGSGESPIATSSVTVDYKGYFTDGSVFDESTQSITFGLNNVIQGWQEALPLLKRGSTGTFLLPSDLAYGPTGNNSIPPNTMLIFDITLVDFN